MPSRTMQYFLDAEVVTGASVNNNNFRGGQKTEYTLNGKAKGTFCYAKFEGIMT